MLNLPSVIAAYFQVAPDAEITALAEVFAPDAHVHDENNDFHGIAAIREWRVKTYAATPFVVRPVDLVEQDGTFIVRAEVSGAFPGSPVLLNHKFTLRDGRIASLDIR